MAKAPTLVVAGGGIAGVATAIAAKRAGLHVEVLERAETLSDVGAGLAIWPNGSRALTALGVRVLPAMPVRALELRTWRGRLLTDTPVRDFRNRYGYDMIMVHRAELHATLLRLLGSENVRSGSEVTGFEQDGSVVRVALKSGEQREAGILIGADGLRSSVRRALLNDGGPRYSGATCWRGVARFEVKDACALNWWGPGSEFGVFPLSEGRAYWFAVVNKPEGEADGVDGRKADVLRAFESWPDQTCAVVEATEEAEILRNDLYDRPPSRSWTRGGVTLVGDAAHPMLPNAAQGACQALEDAAALADVLASYPPELALQAYEARRLRRANRFVTQSWQTGRARQSTNAVFTGLMNFVVSHVPRSLLLSQLDAQILRS